MSFTSLFLRIPQTGYLKQAISASMSQRLVLTADVYVTTSTYTSCDTSISAGTQALWSKTRLTGTQQLFTVNVAILLTADVDKLVLYASCSGDSFGQTTEVAFDNIYFALSG